MSIPHHPRYGERWFECAICGLDFPYHMATRHYLSNRLVDSNCADLKTQSDYLKDMVIPFEKRQISEQPVKCQGEAVDSAWNSAIWYDGVWYGEGHLCEMPPRSDPAIWNVTYWNGLRWA